MRFPWVVAKNAEAESSAVWLASFHSGDKEILEYCYRCYFESAFLAAGRVVDGADQETVVQEVFCQLLSNPDLRLQYRGGSLGAWLSTIAYHRAIDFQRRRRRESSLGSIAASEPIAPATLPSESTQLINRFRDQVLPAKWQQLFELRFLAERSQRDVAQTLKISRTTLVYQEYKIRQLLRRFLLEGKTK